MPVFGTLGGAHMYMEQPKWDISGLTHAGLKTGPNNLTGCRFGDNGKYLFVGTDGSDIYRYPLTTPYDVSTLTTYDQSALNVIVDWVRAIEFRPDGRRLYIGQDATPNLSIVVLGTPWDLTSMGSTNTSSVVSDDVSGLSLSPNGKYLFVAEYAGTDQVHRHVFNNNYNIFSLQAADQSFTYGGIRGVRMHPDGIQMLLIGESADTLDLYDMTTPWDLTTATLTTSKSMRTWTGNPMDVDISADGKHLITVSYSGNEINYFTL